MNETWNIAAMEAVWGYVIVKPEDVTSTDAAFKAAREAGVQFTDRSLMSGMLKQTEAELVSHGGNAFDQCVDFTPRAGMRVVINKYAGFCMADNLHRTMTDSNVLALISEETVIPLWGNVLIRQDRIEDTDSVVASAKKAGLVITEAGQEGMQKGQVYGEVLSFGGNAFEEWKGRVPRVGDRVLFAKSSGFELDKERGRLIADTDIMVVLQRG